MSFLDLFRPNTMPGQNAVAPIMQPNVAMFGSMAPPQPTNWMQQQQPQQPPPQYRNLPVGSGDMSGLKGWAMPKPDAYFGGGTTDSPTPMAMGMMNTPAPQPAQPAGNPRLYSPRAPVTSGPAFPSGDTRYSPVAPATMPPSTASMPGAQQSSPSAPLASATPGQETPTNWMAGIASVLDTLPALGNPGASGGGGSVGGGGGGGGVPTNWMGGGFSNPLQPTNWKQPSLFGGK